MARLVGGVLTLLLMAGAPAYAEDEPDWRGSAREALDQLENALEGLKGMVEGLPSYGMPYLDENGDIVIPRREEPQLAPAPGEPDIVEI
ncbi:MAG TPA: hypothetical protein VED46_05415 [Alphaproteobacteria bacterium]|nr:hypothetical protein [Alphaproteobacteria bacterium]